MPPLLILALLLLLTPEEAQQGFVPLFDGHSLQGWDGDGRLWSVRDGTIIGSTEGTKLTHNSFLISKAEYGDFTLRLQAKLRNHNSGVQFRSEALPDHVVRGYQADMAEDNWWGSLYEELGTRGTMVNGWKDKAEKVVRKGGWNDLEVRCQGDLIQIRVNGLLTAEAHDSARRRGVIALQLHQGPAMQVEFRDIRIKQG